MHIMPLIRRKNWKQCVIIIRLKMLRHNTISVVRNKMRNSLTLGPDEVARIVKRKRAACYKNKNAGCTEDITFTDMIRGEVSFNTSQVDDKVLLKADGMPTYHLAVVVDDYLMQITHAFRGEEWLPCAPVHILLWQYLFGDR